MSGSFVVLDGIEPGVDSLADDEAPTVSFVRGISPAVDPSNMRRLVSVRGCLGAVDCEVVGDVCSSRAAIGVVGCVLWTGNFGG